MSSQSSQSINEPVETAERVDVFPDFAIITLNYLAKQLTTKQRLNVPPHAILDSIRVYNDSGRPIIYIMKPPSSQSMTDILSGAETTFEPEIEVKIGETTSVGNLLKLDKHSVTINEGTVIRKIFNPTTINTNVSSVGQKGTIDLYNVKNPTSIYLQFATRDISMDANYQVNLDDQKLSIIRRYHITNSDFKYEYKSINLYGGNISLDITTGLDDKQRLLHLEGPIATEGLIISMSEPITVDYQQLYEHVIGTNLTKELYTFTTPKDLIGGPARFYYKHEYIGTTLLPKTKSGNIVMVNKGVSSLKTKSIITIKPLGNINNSISTSSITSPPPAKSGEKVTIDVDLVNTSSENITVILIYIAPRQIQSTGTHKPSNVVGNRYEWRVSFKPNEKSRVKIPMSG